MIGRREDGTPPSHALQMHGNGIISSTLKQPATPTPRSFRISSTQLSSSYAHRKLISIGGQARMRVHRRGRLANTEHSKSRTNASPPIRLTSAQLTPVSSPSLATGYGASNAVSAPFPLADPLVN